MKKNTPILKLNLAPKLKRPLSLFNPLDYLRLLYWVSDFPQAIHWYLDTYGSGERSVKSKLIIQSSLLMLLVYVLIHLLPIIMITLFMSNNINWILIFCDTAITILGATVYVMTESLTASIVFVVAVGVMFSLVLRVEYGIIIFCVSFMLSVTVGAYCVTNFAKKLYFFSVFNLVRGANKRNAKGLAWCISVGVTVFGIVGELWFLLSITKIENYVLFNIVFGIVFGIIFGITLGFLGGMVFGGLWVVIIRVARCFMSLASLLNPSFLFNYSLFFPHVNPCYLPYFAKYLEKSLLRDWQQGTENINQVLRFSLQYVPVIKSINQALKNLPDDQLFINFSYLIENIYDLDIMYFISASYKDYSKLIFSEELLIFILPKFLLNAIANKKINAGLKFDTLVQVTAAIFWLLTQEELVKDKNIFNQVRSLSNGEELFTLYDILVTIHEVKELENFTNINLPNIPHEPYLYPTIWTAINSLYQVITEVKNIYHNPSPVVRSLSLNRAIGELNEILENAGNLPRVGKKSIVKIAEYWKKLLEGITKLIGTITITEEIPNPYIIGNPVVGKLFVGREDIIRGLREIWLNPNELQSVILYGHRRMGKTSILRNVVEQLADKIAVIHVNLLLLGSCSNGLADVLIKISADIEQQLNIEVPTDQEFLTLPERTFERYLKKVLKELQNHRLIIALDEFEKLETLMNEGKIPSNFMEYLRGLVQMDKRLGFALAGLHTLEEMTADYFAPFFASVINIKVGFLNYKATEQVLAIPNDEFLISYNTDTLQLIYQLTFGQPYLVQLIGFQLVSRYNDLAFELKRKIEPVFTVEDVNAIINEEFFQRGRYYFTGVWGQAAQGALGQQQIIKVLAPEKAGLSYEELKEKTQLTDKELEEAINTLKRHDVIGEKELKYSISVELFRRWVVDYKD